ncbi:MULTISPECIES: helix-turn-helix domain-containing protein [Paenibacillus]|uniref:helix-turn-helix domain-containing protein n=1 Tax=Paenibacillus TaxID=44249 RepID=UPI001F464801|nr:helix-turn-helix transcriptional regulator [Paenibacillus sp. JJ-223]
MGPEATICSQIERHMNKEGYKLQRFSELSGVNVGTLSAILKGKRPLSMNQLDKITAAMGLELGFFYEKYAIESFVEGETHWRRLEPFLNRCAELNKLQCIKKVVTRATDDRSYINQLFKLAEKWYETGLYKAALILYKCVAEIEKYQHSEKLAICHYRIFILSLDSDSRKNLRLTAVFEKYVDCLDEDHRLDAIKDLMNVYSACLELDKLYDTTIKLEEAVQTRKKYTSNKTVAKSKYPIFVYEAYAYLMRGSFFSHTEQYEKALLCVEHYQRITLINDPTREELIHINKFREWAKLNSLLYNVMMGNMTKLREYIQCIIAYKDEEHIALGHIFKAANKYDYDVDFVIIQFEELLNKFYHFPFEGDVMTSNKFVISMFYELSRYHLRKKRYDKGIRFLLKSLEGAINNWDYFTIVKCLDLYGENRGHATLEQEKEYERFLQTMSMETPRYKNFTAERGLGTCERKKYGTN